MWQYLGSMHALSAVWWLGKEVLSDRRIGVEKYRKRQRGVKRQRKEKVKLFPIDLENMWHISGKKKCVPG